MGEVSQGGGLPVFSQGGSTWGNQLGGEVRGSAVQAQTIHGDVYFGAQPGRLPAPTQLPSPAPHFTGRSGELAALRQFAATGDPPSPVTLVVMTGVGGVGKTSLALHWLHQAREGYPGGQLFADLGAFGPGEPVSPADVLAQFLRALGIAPDRIPGGLEERASLYRSVTGGRRILVLLDDAVSAAQVRALLPGPGPSLVAVTARRRLAGLVIDGAHFLDVAPLPEDAAVELLGRIAGAERTEAQLDAARTLVRLCGHLPLAICVSAARLAPYPQRRIERVAQELESERRRLSALSVAGDIGVRTVFDLSYRALTPAAARTYRLAALIPGPDFGPGVAEAATDAGPGAIGLLLDNLTDASLLQETGERRYQFHELIRLHAREQADAEPGEERHAAVDRIIEWYLQATAAADLTVIPGRWLLGDAYERARLPPAGFGGPAEALDWLESELPGIFGTVRLAADEGMHDKAWQLCEALWGLLVYRQPYRLWTEAVSIGLASAQARANLRAQARMLIYLGFARLRLGEDVAAREYFTQALALDRADGHRLGEATALENLGLASLSAGDPGTALEHFTRARTIHEQIGRPRGAALMTRRIGEAHRDAGHYDQAISYLLDARDRFAALADHYNHARSLTAVAQAHLIGGQTEDALPLLRESLATMTRLAARPEQARLHVLLADAARQLGETTTEAGHLHQAVAIYHDIGARSEEPLRARLEALGSGQASSDLIPNENDSPPS